MTECSCVSLFNLCVAARVEQVMQYDRYLSAHYRFYTREMRILAYSQLLESYRSLTLEYMAKAFGVTTHFIDQLVGIGYLFPRVMALVCAVSTSILFADSYNVI